MSDHTTQAPHAASFDSSRPAVVIEHLRVTDSDVVAEARRWSTGRRGASVTVTEMGDADLGTFVTQAMAVGARAIAGAGNAQDTFELERLVAEVGIRTAESSTSAAEATAKAAASAAETMERIINMFPPHQKQQICLRLSTSLMGIISQKLLPLKDQKGRIAAVEILTATPTTVKLVEEGRSGQLYTAISEGTFFGMQTMNQCLAQFFMSGVISEQEALANAGNLTELKQMMRRPPPA